MINRYGLACVLVFWGLSVRAVTIISEIEFIGNDVTREALFFQEMQTREGDELDIKTIESDVQAIMDLGLFRTVEYEIEEIDEDDPERLRLLIEVREKHYLLLLPRLRLSDTGEFNAGIKVSWRNLGGMNQSLDWLVEERGETFGVSDIRRSLTYSYPRIMDSPYQVSFYGSTRDAVVNAETEDPQLRQEQAYGVHLFRWFNPLGQSSGLYASVGLNNQQRFNLAYFPGDQTLPDFGADFINFSIGYRDINEYLYYRRGKDVGYILSTSGFFSPADESFTQHYMFYRSYYRLKSRPTNNLNVQAVLGISEGDFLGDKAFALGGSALRGYEKDEFKGNALIQINMEYLIPFTADPIYRYGYFMDIGNAFEDVDSVNISDLHVGIGMGMRIKLVAYVGVDLRIDLGYAVDNEDYRFTVGSRHAF